MSSHARFGPNTPINNIRQAMSSLQAQADTSSFATPATADVGLAQENIEKMKGRKVSQISFIMPKYKARGDHKKAELLQKISNLYEEKKAVHGFTPSTTLYEVYTKLRNADPQNSQVDELADLFTGVGI